MSPRVTEIVKLRVTEDDLLRKNHLAFTNIAQAFHDSTACIHNQAWGASVEDPETWIWLLDWESCQKTVEENAYNDMVHLLRGSVSSTLTIAHVAFDPDALKRCYSAPVTEMVFATIKPGVDTMHFESLCESIRMIACNANGCYGVSWGFTSEDHRRIVFIFGWESIQHHEAMFGSRVFEATGKSFRNSVCEAKMFRVAFNYTL
ncbi:hypothetical protein HGRIS_007313 [Hohenbuehelia grisea]|uniref:ABM domain-containing protein n=1 Tax=Hohenbuehelia grisea TaxID=104357 RepID=A0ABR3J4D2_9AGAR